MVTARIYHWHTDNGSALSRSGNKMLTGNGPVTQQIHLLQLSPEPLTRQLALRIIGDEYTCMVQPINENQSMGSPCLSTTSLA